LFFRCCRFFFLAGFIECGGLWFKLFQNLEQDVIIGLIVDRMNIDVADDSFFVNHKNGALTGPFWAKDTISSGCLAMRVKVAEQRISDPPQTFSPGRQARYAVNAETQNLGLDPFKPV
jgi:hypothetical protein